MKHSNGNSMRRLSRRRALAGVGAMVGTAALTGCSSDSGGDGSTSVGTSTGADGSSGGSTGGSTGGPIGSECNDPGDLSPQELMTPIENIVVVMMENRSFDHYFGSLSLEEGEPVDGLTGSESNSDSAGNAFGPFKSDLFVVEDDPPHGHEASKRQFNGGANDGFVTEYEADNAADPGSIMGYHVREQLPIFYALADNYVLCDRWFASFMGGTWPNRFYLHLATAGGQTVNEGITGFPSIFDRMGDAGLPATYYSSNLPVPLTYGSVDGILQNHEFFEHAASGDLPALSFVEPTFTAQGVIGNDDHPPAHPAMGQAFIASVYQALANSPQWEKSLLVITYDEHGGFYDHVPPPKAFDEDPNFEQLGFRVPSLIIGPHVRRGCVSSVQFDHVSVAATATQRFGLEPLNERVTRTNDLSSAIDPAFVSDPQPPITLPPVEIGLPPPPLRDRNAGGQQELWDLVQRARLPKHLDRRAASHEVLAASLEWGERLGAIKRR